MIDDIVPPKGGSGGTDSRSASRKPIFINQPAKLPRIADEPAESAAPAAELIDLPETPLENWGDTPKSDDAPAVVPAPADDVIEAVEPDIPPETKSKRDTKDGKRWRWPLDRTWTIISAVGLVLLLTAGGFAVHANKSTVKSGVVLSKRPAKPAPKVTTVASSLSGLQVDKAVNDRPVIAAMIENSPDARPQSGLDQAGIVFEALAEGGVTRFMALFQDTQPTYIGPIRSARPYYVQWSMAYQASYAHVGGSPDALADITNWKVRDLNQFYNAGAYSRISSRAAPHNVYTSVVGLAQLAQSKGYNSSTFTGFARKAEAKSKAPTATAIDFSFSGPTYNPHFDYNAPTNSYNRSQAGGPHMVVDASGAQKEISPKVVIGLVVPMSRGALDASGAYYSDYNPIGSGKAYVFQDGILTMGTWTKTANEAPLTLTDANGQPLKLNPGQTWISAVPTPESVSYK